MVVTREIFEAYLNCPAKAFLQTRDLQQQSELTKWQARVRDRFEASAQQHLHATVPDDRSYIGTPSPEEMKNGRYDAIFKYVAVSEHISSDIDALLAATPTHKKSKHVYSAVRFVSANKVTRLDKLLVTFDALALGKACGETPQTGILVHGAQFRTIRVAQSSLLKSVCRVIFDIRSMQKADVSPPIILNKHCGQCAFRNRCRSIAAEKDDLSRIPNISQKQRGALHNKGIFTVTQLSYTFRPRRRPPQPPRVQPALKALAIRTNRIHVVGSPALQQPTKAVYFDVEGDPDRDFYYLIGLRIISANAIACHSFWADSPSNESHIWADFLTVLRNIDEPQLIHYGAYESKFLRQMKTRYSNGDDDFLDRLTGSALNLLSMISTQVYFPTYSNGLKEVAGHLGFRWTDSDASGLNALMWRSQWEDCHNPTYKQKLLTYNLEDCEAAEVVASALYKVCQPSRQPRPESNLPDVVRVDSMKAHYPRQFGEVQFRLPEFETINNASYWDYQRDKVFVRSKGASRPRHSFSRNAALARIRPIREVAIQEQRPPQCERCGHKTVYKWGRFSQAVYDLRFSSRGLKRSVTRYWFNRFICWQCKRPFFVHEHQQKYGRGLCAYIIYQMIDLRLAGRAVANAIDELFGLPLSESAPHLIKTVMAEEFQVTYKRILRGIVSGNVVHADETQVEIDGTTRYVWVFTNTGNVAFVYSDTREATLAQDILRDFRGVLVSDFYAGYDSLECTQQKCLVHLIRDMNDDLCKNPFNEELKGLTQCFAQLVRPIIASIDRFGLRAIHLKKHRAAVQRFYRGLADARYETEVTVAYRKRLERNRGRLFTFLEHDDVPWNNNNAEHAIKAFARLRRNIGGKSTVKGIIEYLTLLSISETCKYRGVSFLDFLLSGKTDLDGFCARSFRKSRRSGRGPILEG